MYIVEMLCIHSNTHIVHIQTHREATCEHEDKANSQRVSDAGRCLTVGIYFILLHTHTQSVYRHVLVAGKTIKLRNKQTPLFF